MEHFDPAWLQLLAMVLGFAAMVGMRAAEQKWDREKNQIAHGEAEKRDEELAKRCASLEAWRLEIERVRGSTHADHERYNSEIEKLWRAVEKKDRRS